MARINPEEPRYTPGRLHAFLVQFGVPMIPFLIGMKRTLFPRIVTFLPTLFMGA